MIVSATLVLTVLTFAFIVYPLFKRRLRPMDSVEDEKTQELYSRKDTAYSMLKELEFDFQSGILTDEDYRDLEARYREKAIATLKDIDSLEKIPVVEEEIEKQVQKLRRGKSASVDDALEKEILELRQGKGQFCPQCGARCQEGDRFCSRCGTSLREGEDVD